MSKEPNATTKAAMLDARATERSAAWSGATSAIMSLGAELELARRDRDTFRALCQEGATGFGRILIATGDDKAVYDWMTRCKAALDGALTEPEFGFPVGTRVRKIGGDYSLTGTVVAAFKKASGQVRYVVEADYPAGLLHIYGPVNLERLT